MSRVKLMFALFFVMVIAHAQAAKPTNISQGHKVTEYLRNVQDEIILARTAAPTSISADAEILVLGEHGYEVAAEGHNGFVCYVQRSWMAGFDDPDFWDPELVAPNCYDPPAVRSVLPFYLERAKWVMAGASKSEIMKRTRNALSEGDRHVPEPGALTYMLSPRGNLSKADGHWVPHMMFFLPKDMPAVWGANLKDSPMFGPVGGELDPFSVIYLPVRRWSDGTMALGEHPM